MSLERVALNCTFNATRSGSLSRRMSFAKTGIHFFATCSNRWPTVTKIFSILILAMMIVHIIRPLGMPGLKKRGDFWKLAVVAFAAIVLTAGLSHSG